MACLSISYKDCNMYKTRRLELCVKWASFSISHLFFRSFTYCHEEVVKSIVVKAQRPETRLWVLYERLSKLRGTCWIQCFFDEWFTGSSYCRLKYISHCTKHIPCGISSSLVSNESNSIPFLLEFLYQRILHSWGGWSCVTDLPQRGVSLKALRD